MCIRDRLGYGCWGVVDEYTDLAGQKWAIKRFAPNEIAKRQMLERNLTEEDVMRNEAIPLSAAQHNLVPRIIERDKNGELYVGMPVYDKTLKKVYLDNRGKRDFRKIAEIGKNVADALVYLHEELKRAHGDIKEDNIIMDNEKPLLTDLGSSTCISVGRSENPRDNIGERLYRAPECFEQGSCPDTRSDVFSFSSLLYTMLTGKHLYKEHSNLHELEAKEANKIIRKDIRKYVPRKFRKILRKGLDFDRNKRYYNGAELKKDLELIRKFWEDKNFYYIAYVLKKYGLEFKGIIHTDYLIKELLGIIERREGLQRSEDENKSG